MSKLIGTGPNQVPSNADLGDLAFQNSEFPQLKNIRLTGSMILGDEATAATSVLGRNLTLPTGSSGDLFLFGPSPEIAFLDSNARRSSAIEGQDGDINFYSNNGDGTSINATVDGSSKATSDADTLKTITIHKVTKDVNGNFSDGGDLNILLGDLQISGTSVIDASRRGTFGALGTTAAASALRIGMNNTNFVNGTPTMQIYHYNYPDDNTTNVASLDIRVGNEDADLPHHGPLQLRQIFTGSARNSPTLQFWTNANSSNDKGVIMLQGISGTVPGFYVYSDLLGSSESAVDLVPYNLFRTSANQSAITNNASPTVNDGNNTLKLINDRSGSEQAGALGAGLVLAQRWWNGNTENVRAAGIYGYKSGGNGNFGGGLKIYTQPTNSGNDMAIALTITGYQESIFEGPVYGQQGGTFGGGMSLTSTGELSGCPFTHVRLANTLGTPYNDRHEGRLTVSNLPGSGQRYMHFITSASGSSHIKVKIFSLRSGSEYMMAASQFECRWYSESDGDFRAWNFNGYENVGRYQYGFEINNMPTGYLVDYSTNLDTSGETARRTDNQWGYAVIRVPLYIFQNSSGADEFYITIEEHAESENSWWVGLVGH